MKRFSLYQLTVVSLLLLFISCQKRGDFEVPCKILRVAQHNTAHAGAGTFNGIFEYTPWGDPAKITWDLTTTGRPNYIFKYDKKHRFTEFIGSYGANYDFVTKYMYGADNFIVGDTTWFSGLFSDVPGTAYMYIVNKYTYDSKGRVRRIDHKVSLGPEYSSTYDYDANGNKIRDDGAVYDNQKNYLRTNLILMFLNRDYSVNNPRVADAYNNKKLPLSFASSGGVTFMNSIIDEIEYDCGPGH